MTRLDELTIYQFYILKGQFNVLTLVFDEGGKKKKKSKKRFITEYSECFRVLRVLPVYTKSSEMMVNCGWRWWW